MCTLTGHSDCVYWVAFSPDGKRVVSASWDTLVKIWNAETGAEVRSFVGFVYEKGIRLKPYRQCSLLRSTFFTSNIAEFV